MSQLSKEDIANICEKAAGIIREKGKFSGDLWQNSNGEYGYVEGPVCAIGALSIASGTHQGPRQYGVYRKLVDEDILDAVAAEARIDNNGLGSSNRIYSYSDRPQTTAEDVARMFERAAKAVTSE